VPHFAARRNAAEHQLLVNDDAEVRDGKHFASAFEHYAVVDDAVDVPVDVVVVEGVNSCAFEASNKQHSAVAVGGEAVAVADDVAVAVAVVVATALPTVSVSHDRCSPSSLRKR